MKKGRPGVLLTCLCPPATAEEVVRAIFRHTTTIGVREHLCHRHTLDRVEQTVATRYGDVRVVASGYGVRRSKPEYADLVTIAEREGISLDQAAGAVTRRPQRSGAVVSAARNVRHPCIRSPLPARLGRPARSSPSPCCHRVW